MLLAQRCGFSDIDIRRIRIAALMHDIGKLKIAPSILYKPGKLDAQEFEVMKTHTTLGAEMLVSIRGELGELVRDVCRYHHEWHNGQGYWGRGATELSPHIPIVSIADVFTALVTERPYKPAWPVRDALGYIQKQAGTQFSRELVEVFTSLITASTYNERKF